MKRYISIFAILLLTQSIYAQQEQISARDTLYQFSTIQAIKAGVYDGMKPYSDIMKRGDFGIGTFADLDGEMIELDGVIYQVKVNGDVLICDSQQTAPYTTVTFFDSDQIGVIKKSMDYPQLKKFIDKILTTKNVPVAIKLTGKFSYVKTRSVAAQKKPYPPLSEVVKHQQEFEMTNVTGTAVGFRFPAYMDQVQAVGYHLHFITDDHKAGGHLLAFQTDDVKLELDYTHEFLMELPDGGDFYAVNETDK